MRLLHTTLDDKKYWVHLEKYKATRVKQVSDFQFKWKMFFMKLFPLDFWCEEFPVRPFLRRRFRADLYNYTRKFMVECHGDQHVAVSGHFHGGSQESFLDALMKDRQKELWCEKNKLELITVYTSTPMDKDFLKKRYPSIRWT